MSIISPTNLQSARSTGKQRISPHVLRETAWGYLFLLPTIVLVGVLGIYPQFASWRYALYNWNGIGAPDQYVGFQHFVEVATDPYFWNAYVHTFEYTLFLVPIQLTLALILALVLNNPRLRFNTFYRALFFMPALTTPSVVAIVIGLLATNITTNTPDWLIRLGFRPDLGLFNDPHLAFPMVIAFGIWHTFGYNLVYFLAALQTVPVELYESARIDGAGRFARFWFITIPMIRPVGLIITFFATMGSLGVFDAVWILTQGGPLSASEVISTYIYRNSFGADNPNYGFASAASIFVSITFIGLSILNLLVLRSIARRKTQANITPAA